MKSRIRVILLLAVSVIMLIPVAVNSFAYADACVATLSSPVTSQYASANGPLVVPVSASCTTYYNQLYADGNAYDATSNIGLGTANAILSPLNGGTQLSGQLGFNLPPTAPTDSVQVSVSIYDSQGGNLITQTSETVQLGAGTQAGTVGQSPTTDPPWTGYQSPYQPNQSPLYGSQPQYQPPYQQQYQPQYRSQYQQGNQDGSAYYYSRGFPYRSNRFLLAWLAIVAILAAVIIATAGLVLLGRRQPQPICYPVPPPPPQR